MQTVSPSSAIPRCSLLLVETDDRSRPKGRPRLGGGGPARTARELHAEPRLVERMYRRPQWQTPNVRNRPNANRHRCRTLTIGQRHHEWHAGALARIAGGVGIHFLHGSGGHGDLARLLGIGTRFGA